MCVIDRSSVHLLSSVCCFVLGCAPDPPCAPVDDVTHVDSSEVELYVSGANPYESGALTVRTVDFARCEYGVPVETRVHVPEGAYRWPVVVFQHGFLVDVSLYSEVLVHLASHGFVVVAPQMYAPQGLPVGMPSVDEEVALALAVLDWVEMRLASVLDVDADVTLIGLAGHSRGGRVVWSVLRQDDSLALAVAGVDPVDSTAGPFDCGEAVTAEPFPFALPTLVVGAGRGSDTGLSCAPPGRNHEQFFAASPGPAWHVVAPEAGHMDLLDANLDRCGWICSVCPVGTDREAMRPLTGGMLVAFFRGALVGDTAGYDWLTDVGAAPMAITVERR
jgi:chlorophyllase